MSLRFVFLFCGTALAAAQTETLSLDQAIRLAWANDPTVTALALAPELTAARETQAGLRPNPELELRGSAPVDGNSEWSVGAGLTQRLPRRERVELARAYAAVGGELAAVELRERRHLLAAEVRRLWYDQVVLRARLAATRKTMALQEDILQSLRGRRTAGEVTDAEWDLLELELARAKQNASLAEADLLGGEGRLRRRLRMSADAPLSLGGDLDRLLDQPVPPAGALSATLPGMALADYELRRAEAAAALARGESRGDWSVGAGLDFERRSNDATGRLENEPRLAVSASAPWPGNRIGNRGDILEREALVKIARSSREARRDELLAALDAAVTAARTAQPAVQNFRALLATAAGLPRRLGPAYQRGEVTGFQLAQARQQHLAIEAEFFTAAARYLTTLAEAEAAAGLVPSQP